MKHFIAIIATFSIAISAMAQSENFHSFADALSAKDTLRMKQILLEWEDETPRLYRSWTSYFLVKGDLEEDASYWDKAVEWAENGLRRYPDSLAVMNNALGAYYHAEEYPLAEKMMKTIQSKGIDDEVSWMYFSEIYSMKNSPDSIVLYLNLLKASTDSSIVAFADKYLNDINETVTEMEADRIVPDQKRLKAFSKKKEFSELVERFRQADRALTLQEISDIYYGSAYLSLYEVAAQKASSGEKLLSEGKYEQALEELSPLLEKYPLSYRILFDCYMAYSELGKDKDELTYKLLAIIGAILNSGDGTSAKTPFHVICVDDEYNFLRDTYGIQAMISQSLSSDNQDILRFINEYGVEQKCYFELSPAYWAMYEGL